MSPIRCRGLAAVSDIFGLQSLANLHLSKNVAYIGSGDVLSMFLPVLLLGQAVGEQPYGSACHLLSGE